MESEKKTCRALNLGNLGVGVLGLVPLGCPVTCWCTPEMFRAALQSLLYIHPSVFHCCPVSASFRGTKGRVQDRWWCNVRHVLC